jgi:uncharacterized RDD family membrane protein YckC
MLDFDLIETSESVELQRRLAGIGSRSLAGMLDMLLLALVYFLLFLVLWFSGVFSAGFRDVLNWMLALWIIVMFLVSWGYFILFEFLTNGQSPGKKAVKIRVVQEEGGGLPFSAIAIRNLLRAADFLPLGYGIGIVTMFCSKKAQRLGDLAAGTVVVSEERADYAALSDKKKAVYDDDRLDALTLGASGLTPTEYRVLHNYWIRRNQLTVEARERLLPKLVLPLLEREGGTLPDHSLVQLEAYVEKVIVGTGHSEGLDRAGGEDPV